MIIHDRFVFIHNCHCGGNTVRIILKNMFPHAKHLPLHSGHWHKPVRALYKNDYWGKTVTEIGENDKNKIKFGYVRNPWDWYVSFYYHQKRSNGLFYKTFTTPGKDDFETFVTNLLSPVVPNWAATEVR